MSRQRKPKAQKEASNHSKLDSHSTNIKDVNIETIDAYKHKYKEQLQKRLSYNKENMLSSSEILELFLLRSSKKRNAHLIVAALFKRFDTLNGILSATESRLKEIPGVTKSIIEDLSIARNLATSINKEKIQQKPLLNSWSSVLEYCRLTMAYEEREQIRVLFLNKRNILILEEVLQIGTVDHTPVYPREIIKRALELSASALILVHNHPSGDPNPSLGDIHMTNHLINALKSFSIELHDHIIITKEGYASFRALKLLR